jgi:hypothetical protein
MENSYIFFHAKLQSLIPRHKSFLQKTSTLFPHQNCFLRSLCLFCSTGHWHGKFSYLKEKQRHTPPQIQSWLQPKSTLGVQERLKKNVLPYLNCFWLLFGLFFFHFKLLFKTIKVNNTFTVKKRCGCKQPNYKKETMIKKKSSLLNQLWCISPQISSLVLS